MAMYRVVVLLAPRCASALGPSRAVRVRRRRRPRRRRRRRRRRPPRRRASSLAALPEEGAEEQALRLHCGGVQTYIDVTGKSYVEVDTFVPKFDEVGVLPPLGRWDPLQIREQVRFALAPLLGLSAAHAPRCGLAIRASGSWREGGHMTAGSAVAKFSAILLLPGCRFLIFWLPGRPLHRRVSASTLIQFSHSHWPLFCVCTGSGALPPFCGDGDQARPPRNGRFPRRRDHGARASAGRATSPRRRASNSRTSRAARSPRGPRSRRPRGSRSSSSSRSARRSG